MISPPTQPSTEDVARHYDELDAFYRGVWGEHLHHGYWVDGDETVEEAVRNLVDLVARRGAITEDEVICDIGCGHGATAAYLAGQHHVDVTGITLSPAQCRYAIENSSSTRCRFVVGDWLSNDFKSDHFDIALGIECLSHMADKSRFFEEALRVLLPEGRLVLCMWLASESATHWQIRHLLEPICREGRLPSMPSVRDVVGLAEAGGFVDVEVQDLSLNVRRTWGICARRVAAKLYTDARYRRYLLDSSSSDRAFLKSIFRVMVAYRTGAMEYGLLVAKKPA